MSSKLERRDPDVFVHDTAVVDSGARIGNGTKVWHFCHVMEGAEIGENCILGQNVFVAGGTVIGDRVKIQNNVSVYAGVTLEDDVFCGPSAVFTNVRNPRAHVDRKHAFSPTLVGKGATLGANCTVVCGNNIGAYAMVGAGAVITADIPSHALAVGVPARIAGWICSCGERLDAPSERPEHAVCIHCAATLRAEPDGRGLREYPS